MSEFDLAALFRALARERTRFVAIGGVAVAAHGYVRATEDVDLVPDPSPENLDRLGDGLVRLNARLRSGRPFGPEQRRTLKRGRNLTLLTDHGQIDVVQRLPGLPSFDELDGEAQSAELLGIPVRVCSLAHLRAMKRARAGLQDLADLERLPEA